MSEARYWQVSTVHNNAWNLVGPTGIERLQEMRSFHVVAPNVEEAIKEVLKFGGGGVIGMSDITCVQAV